MWEKAAVIADCSFWLNAELRKEITDEVSTSLG
jgi:hypothetical protein